MIPSPILASLIALHPITMNLAAGLMAKARQENRAIDLATASPPISAAMEDVGEITPYEVCWRRMTILLRISMMHANTGLILMEMEEMRNRCAEEAAEGPVGGVTSTTTPSRQTSELLRCASVAAC